MSGVVVDAADADLIAQSLRQPDRFAALFDRHAPVIHRYVARRAGPAVADDLVAETFLAAFARRDTYDLARRDARPWLYGIATNLLGQHRRDELRQLRLLRAIPAEPDAAGPDDAVAADMTAEAVRRPLAAALATLTPGDRDVLLLVAWEQLTYPQAAQALGIPVGTVRSRLSRARSQLRAALAGSGAAETVKEILGHE